MDTQTNETATTEHVFETAGLGKAPFRFAGFEYKTFQAHPDAPVQCGGSCDYCGRAISNMCYVVAADGKRFKVGPDCIEKTGDKGLRKAATVVVSNHRKALAAVRAAAGKARDLAIIDGARAALERAEVQAVLRGKAHPQAWAADKGLTLYDWATWMIVRAGTTGRLAVANVVAQAAAQVV